MSDEESGSDKPYEATQHKLDEARKRGEFARSQDAMTLVYLASFIAALHILFGYLMWPLVTDIQRHVVAEFQRPLVHNFDGDLGQAMHWVGKMASILFLIPFAVIAATLIAFRQVVFAKDKLQMKLNRISVVANFKKKFGVSGMVEFLKSFLKSTAFVVLLIVWLSDTSDRFDMSVLLGEHAMLLQIFKVSISWIWQILAVYVVFACIDVLWQRHDHANKNRMSHKEMKDEHKNEEGDESVRQQRRAKAQELATNRMLLEVPKSAVIIVNPTHYAVALKWMGGKNEVPTCVAKGVDDTARRIREIAMQSGVPIYRDPKTARHLFASVKLGAVIQQDQYKAVAVAMGYARRIQKMTKA